MEEILRQQFQTVANDPRFERRPGRKYDEDKRQILELIKRGSKDGLSKQLVKDLYASVKKYDKLVAKKAKKQERVSSYVQSARREFAAYVQKRAEKETQRQSNLQAKRDIKEFVDKMKDEWNVKDIKTNPYPKTQNVIIETIMMDKKTKKC